MPATERRIDRSDILPMAEYEAFRKAHRPDFVAQKKLRRLEVGPFATFYFESYQTMWWQVQEMLRIEKGGEEQIADELAAYNPLIPQGAELVATLMFEIDDPIRRNLVLARLTGADSHVALTVGGEAVPGVPDDPEGRTKDDGKISSVHFLRFRLTPSAADAFRRPGTQVTLGITHPAYGHIALMPESVREALAADL
ncbi:MAG: DUF3501 family protein [Alphaproteobacteria bacterium]|jgi:hypothetical protein|nr:DUF3501 family protein [Alphaproteobacteria bacterium]